MTLNDVTPTYMMSGNQTHVVAFFTLRVGMKIYIGTHDSTECESADGCHVVTITHAWTDEKYRFVPGTAPVNDVAVVK